MVKTKDLRKVANVIYLATEEKGDLKMEELRNKKNQQEGRDGQVTCITKQMQKNITFLHEKIDELENKLSSILNNFDPENKNMADTPETILVSLAAEIKKIDKDIITGRMRLENMLERIEL